MKSRWECVLLQHAADSEPQELQYSAVSTQVSADLQRCLGLCATLTPDPHVCHVCPRF